jgi:RNA-binding protein 26
MLNRQLSQGLSKGHNIPIIGPVQISWYTGKSAKTTPLVKTVSPQVGSADNAADVFMSEPTRPRSPEPTVLHSPRIQEEEVIASGWGADSDGEDGMGML